MMDIFEDVRDGCLRRHENQKPSLISACLNTFEWFLNEPLRACGASYMECCRILSSCHINVWAPGGLKTKRETINGAAWVPSQQSMSSSCSCTISALLSGVIRSHPESPWHGNDTAMTRQWHVEHHQEALVQQFFQLLPEKIHHQKWQHSTSCQQVPGLWLMNLMKFPRSKVSSRFDRHPGAAPS